MPQPFVVIVAAFGEPAPAARVSLLAAGARAVLSWSDLLTSDLPDEIAAVLVDVPWATAAEAGTGALAAVVGALTDVETAGRIPAVLVVSTRPITDTLKLVDAAGRLAGTADRDDHRFVGVPIALRLGLLRSVATAGPDPVEVLTALADRGIDVLALS